MSLGERLLGFSRGQGGPPRAEMGRMSRRKPGEEPRESRTNWGWGKLGREEFGCAGSGVRLDSDPGGTTDQLCRRISP